MLLVYVHPKQSFLCPIATSSRVVPCQVHLPSTGRVARIKNVPVSIYHRSNVHQRLPSSVPIKPVRWLPFIKLVRASEKSGIAEL